ncbi:hypothetical protein GBAR_LOCUS15370 [Geodia barretti]|uniref:Uncharacterized protein n=1 Tax=Geodia barretti TaxID=519541 RepID=A0AA35SBU8_GEOBA|nr:hypothetical protein GBAR_LOCUS15370 [Geodia barretti]
MSIRLGGIPSLSQLTWRSQKMFMNLLRGMMWEKNGT